MDETARIVKSLCTRLQNFNYGFPSSTKRERKFKIVVTGHGTDKALEMDIKTLLVQLGGENVTAGRKNVTAIFDNEERRQLADKYFHNRNLDGQVLSSLKVDLFVGRLALDRLLRRH